MRDLLDELKGRRARVVILTETHFDVRESEQFKKMANENGYRSYSIVVESEESRRIDTRVGRRYSKLPARRDSHGRRRLEL